MSRHSGNRHEPFFNHPVDFLSDALRHGAGVVAQLRDSLGGIEFVVAHKVIHGKARHALGLAGHLDQHDLRGLTSLNSRKSCLVGGRHSPVSLRRSFFSAAVLFKVKTGFFSRHTSCDPTAYKHGVQSVCRERSFFRLGMRQLHLFAGNLLGAALSIYLSRQFPVYERDEVQVIPRYYALSVTLNLSIVEGQNA